MAARKDGKSRAEDFAATPMDAWVGSRIRFLRNQNGLAAHHLSARLGLTRQSLEKYEKGMQRISVSRLYEIATILQTNPGWFFEGCTYLTVPSDQPDTAPDMLTAAGVNVVTRFERLNPEQRRAVTLVVAAMDEANQAAAAVA